jgi:hypothetical protein
MLIASMLGRSDFEVALELAEPFTEEGAFDVVVDEHEGLFVRLGGLRPFVQLAQKISMGGAEVAVRRERGIDEQYRQRIQAGGCSFSVGPPSPLLTTKNGALPVVGRAGQGWFGFLV